MQHLCCKQSRLFSTCPGFIDHFHEQYLASDSMNFFEESYQLLFLLMTSPKDIQSSWLEHIQVLQERGMLRDAFRLLFQSLFWLSGHRTLGYSLGIFQSLNMDMREPNIRKETREEERQRNRERSVSYGTQKKKNHYFLALNRQFTMAVP